jgi:hypothetical protein
MFRCSLKGVAGGGCGAGMTTPWQWACDFVRMVWGDRWCGGGVGRPMVWGDRWCGEADGVEVVWGDGGVGRRQPRRSYPPAALSQALKLFPGQALRAAQGWTVSPH